MGPSSCALKQLIDRVHAARVDHLALRVRGGGTKDFYGELPRGEVLDTRAWCGISSHEPSELYVTVRAGTPLAELEAALAEHGQCLPFEPPRFAAGGTVGGMVAAGLSGPARASVGALRDFVLGATLLNGQGQVLTFGGQVIKNVAGYDVSRLLAGSLGTLGLLLEVSLKVLPRPPARATLRLSGISAEQALRQLNLWAGQPLPLNASAWHQEVLHVRLAGATAAVRSAMQLMSATHGGQPLDEPEADAMWTRLRDHTAPFFDDPQDATPLWRLSVPSATPPLALPETPGATDASALIEWGGAQRWWRTDAPPAAIRAVAAGAGGHATLFRATDPLARQRAGVFTPLPEPLARIHRALKTSFDPHGLFNPGRLYPGLL